MTLNANSTNRGGEQREVDRVEWIPIESINNYQWAFEHDKMIEELSAKLGLL